MTAAAHIYPNAVQNLASKAEKWTTGSQDTLCVGLVASGTYTWGAGCYSQTTVSNFLAGDGTDGALTEVAGTYGYGRQALTSPTFTTVGLVGTLTCSTINWSANTGSWSAKYAFFYDGSTSNSNDGTTNELICYWDFGGSVSVVSGGTFTLNINASGLVTFTSS